jgi:hypothetical protein
MKLRIVKPGALQCAISFPRSYQIGDDAFYYRKSDTVEIDIDGVDLIGNINHYLTKQFISEPSELPNDECMNEAITITGLLDHYLKSKLEGK